MDNDKTKPTSDIKDASVKRFKVLKRPTTDTDNPMVKVLESIVDWRALWANAHIFVVIPSVEL
jgi:hypothetical protein